MSPYIIEYTMPESFVIWLLAMADMQVEFRGPRRSWVSPDIMDLPQTFPVSASKESGQQRAGYRGKRNVAVKCVYSYYSIRSISILQWKILLRAK